MRPAYRTGSSSEALSAARRTQLHRGLILVLGVFLAYGLTSAFLPGLLPVKVFGGFRVGELAAAAQVLVIALGVLRHDRHARRHVEPLAQRVATRGPAFHTAGSGVPTAAAPASAATSSASAASSSDDFPEFNAFDSARAFGSGRRVNAATAQAPLPYGTHRAAGATT